MNLKENVPLAPRTTLGVGGRARFFVEAHTEEELQEAIACAHTHALPLYPLGNGSNILIPDAGVAGVVVKIALGEVTFETSGDEALLVAGAGASWEKVVDAAGERGLWGIENLAGIPGTMGGAAVQNIGAYGAELADTFAYADTIDSKTGERKRTDKTEAEFAYRTSFFKKHRELIVVRVALRLSKNGRPNLNYPDLKGTTLVTPKEVALTIRDIRSKKFPNKEGEGTAGSFFKNPVIVQEAAEALAMRFPGLPVFREEGGKAKISLAWLLDHALSLKGFAKGRVRLYEKQPLVVVARAGATAEEIDSFANEIAGKVFSATGVMIEREVETFKHLNI